MKACIICKGENFSLWGRKRGYDIFQCARCGLFFTDLSDYVVEKNSELYGKAYFNGDQEIDFEAEREFFLTRFRDRLKRLSKYTSKGRLLDVGCATGLFLSEAHDNGWNAEGYEISEYAASVAQSKGFKVYASLDDSKLQTSVYDIVTMWHVLEHIENPRSVLTKVYSLLKPGGVIAIEVPDVGSKPAMRQRENWHFVKPPEHIYYFSEDTLSKLLKSISFVPIEFVKLPWGTGLADKVQKVGLGVGESVRRILRVIPGMAKLRDWMIRHLAEPEVLLMIASKSR